MNREVGCTRRAGTLAGHEDVCVYPAGVNQGKNI